MNTKLKFAFGEIHTTERRLVVNGKTIALGGRAFDVLLALVKRPGRVLSKEDLLNEVWPDKSVGDFNVHVQVSMLRRHVGADAIRTVPGRGYFFALLPDDNAAAVGPGGRLGGGTPLFGREADIRAVEDLIGRHRLVVISGPGGVGKTRVAHAVLEREAHRRADSVASIDLTTLASASDIAAAIGVAMKVGFGAKPAIEALATALRPLDATLLLDNAEHLAQEVEGLLHRLQDACPGLRFLVTSQVSLKLPAARHFRLDPLACPPQEASAASWLQYPAVALLQDRIQAIDQHFRLTGVGLLHAGEICRRLDGIPLAIELAAVRCASLGLQAVIGQLAHRFHWMSNGAGTSAERQQSPRHVMAWSYSLLADPEQRAFRRLGVCVGGFSLALAERLLAANADGGSPGAATLASLLDHSLVASDAGRTGHYKLLDTARLFALERLAENNEEPLVRDLHARSMTEIFEQAHLDHWALHEPDFLARYEPEVGNLRAALEWLLQTHSPDAVALGGASGPLWRCLSLQHEAIELLGRAASLVSAATPLPHAARLWESLALQHGEAASTEGREPARRAAALYRQLGDSRGLYLALSHLAYSYRYVDSDEARNAFDELRRLEDPAWPASVRLFGARLELPHGSAADRVQEGRAVNELRLALATETRSTYEANCALVNLADIALTANDTVEAVRLNRSLLQRVSRRHMASRIIILGNLLEALVIGGWLAEAQEAGLQFFEAAQTMNFVFGMFAADALALFAALHRRWGVAALVLGYADLNYSARHRERGPNELAIRQRLWSLLQREVAPQTLADFMARGAGMGARSICLLALNPGANPPSGEDPSPQVPLPGI